MCKGILKEKCPHVLSSAHFKANSTAWHGNGAYRRAGRGGAGGGAQALGAAHGGDRQLPEKGRLVAVSFCFHFFESPGDESQRFFAGGANLRRGARVFAFGCFCLMPRGP